MPGKPFDRLVIIRPAHRSLDVSGRDGIDADAMLGKLPAHFLSERTQAALRGGVAASAKPLVKATTDEILTIDPAVRFSAGRKRGYVERAG